MKFLLNISAAPNSPFAESALQFAQAVIADNHNICGLFFSGLAVKTFSQTEEINPTLRKSWIDFLTKHKQKAFCCAAAADQVLEASMLPQQVEISGLGELVELCEFADRTVCFGSRDS